MVIQQLIQSQLFHLISMLICIGVIVWLFVRHYFQKEQEPGEGKIRHLNTLYISGILTFIIIELVTAICMDNTRHAEILSFVSFAATLSSLILSVVAIIFTIVSGNRGELQYQKLDKVSDEVKVSLASFTDKTVSLDESIERFQSLANALTNQIHEVYEKLSSLEEPIYQLKEQILSPDSYVKDNKKKDGGKEDSFSQHVSGFISKGSFSGNLALYACVLSKEKGRAFSMSEIRENDDDEAYKFGYIIASSAMGMIATKVQDQRRIEVVNCFDGLKEMLEQALDAFVDSSPDTNSKRANQARINGIKSIFG